ncbi:hypothetical protein [Streptomyces sp. NBC_00932]|nr:hypothetical protein OG221_27640 [Streptomyces sp. NBC_00932]
MKTAGGQVLVRGGLLEDVMSGEELTQRGVEGACGNDRDLHGVGG